MSERAWIWWFGPRASALMSCHCLTRASASSRGICLLWSMLAGEAYATDKDEISSGLVFGEDTASDACLEGCLNIASSSPKSANMFLRAKFDFKSGVWSMVQIWELLLKLCWLGCRLFMLLFCPDCSRNNFHDPTRMHNAKVAHPICTVMSPISDQCSQNLRWACPGFLFTWTDGPLMVPLLLLMFSRFCKLTGANCLTASPRCLVEFKCRGSSGTWFVERLWGNDRWLSVTLSTLPNFCLPPLRIRFGPLKKPVYNMMIRI